MEYIYLLVDNSIYINIESGFFTLLYFLFFKAKPFTFLERKTNNKIFNFFIPLVRARRVLEFTYLFYRRKQIYYRSKDSFPTITTIFYGHFLLVSRLGEYKVINFKKKDVTTVFPNNDPITVVENNINKLIKAQKCILAPKITEWDINRRYIKEHFLNLKTPSFDYDNNHNFYLEVFPILENIMLSTTPQVILLRQYQQKMIHSINLLMETYLKKNSSSANSDHRILEFILLIKKKMTIDSPKKEILLAFSHGDFWGGNVLKSKTITGVIDWSTFDKRSCFFDFYFIIFVKVSKTNEVGRGRIVEEINQAFKCFQLHLKENTYFSSPRMPNILNQLDMYRYLFYLELILLRLQEYPKRDQDHMDFLEEWIKLFELYEKNKNEEASIMVGN